MGWGFVGFTFIDYFIGYVLYGLVSIIGEEGDIGYGDSRGY